jgi:hypothetical protein
MNILKFFFPSFFYIKGTGKKILISFNRNETPNRRTVRKKLLLTATYFVRTDKPHKMMTIVFATEPIELQKSLMEQFLTLQLEYEYWEN